MAATNFVVPVLFSLAQIIVVYRNVNVLIINDIVLINTSIAVIGVVFATVWAGTAHWAQDHSQSALDMSEPSRVVFQQRSNLSNGSMGRVEDGGLVELPGGSGSGSFIEFKAQ